MKRETPRFSPSALKPAPPAKLRLCFPDCRPPRPAAGQSDGRTDGQSAGPAQGRGQGGQGGSGGQRWVPPARSPAGAPRPPRGGCLGMLFCSAPSPPGRTAMGAAEALTPPAWQRRPRGSETPPSPAPAPPALRPPPVAAAGAEQSRGDGEEMERRGRLRRGPRPPPPLRPRPRLGRGAGAAFSLSSRPEAAEGLFKFYFLFD